jgi:hypothetical protein
MSATQDLVNDVKATPAFNSQTLNSNATTTGVWIDTQDYEAIMFSIRSATITDGTYTPRIMGSNDSASSYADAELVTTKGAYLGAGVAGATFTATDDNATKKLGAVGNYRYFRLDFTTTGITTGGSIGADAILGSAKLSPVA